MPRQVTGLHLKKKKKKETFGLHEFGIRVIDLKIGDHIKNELHHH